MKVLVLRHATTSYNEQRLLQGRTDIPLSEKGKREAIELGEQLGEERFDIIYCSPLKRTRETAFLLHLNSPIFIDQRLIERNLGKLEGTSLDKFNSSDYASYHDITCQDEVETITEIYERISDFFGELKTQSFKKVLIVTHGGLIKVINDYFNGIPNDGICKGPTLKNGTFLEFNL